MVIRDLAEFAEWLASLPDGTMLPANGIRSIVARLPRETQAPLRPVETVTWRERLWSAPSETRVSVRELAEALGKSKHWIYKRTTRAHSVAIPLPHRRLENGNLEFVVGEIRAWISRVSHEINYHEELKCRTMKLLDFAVRFYWNR
jgi:predicted DNA-binding transcriptional regulator AlpA